MNATVPKQALIDKLTLRQRPVFELLMQGKTNREIATLLTRGIGTVKTHVTDILATFDCTSRAQLISVCSKSDPNDWETLRELIAEYAEAYVADSWSGGDRPEDVHATAVRLEIATVKLNAHIDKMERERS